MTQWLIGKSIKLASQCKGISRQMHPQGVLEQKGKDQKGIYPTSANFSTDLHSLGQFIQEGTRIMFETVVRVDKPRKNVIIPTWKKILMDLATSKKRC